MGICGRIDADAMTGKDEEPGPILSACSRIKSGLPAMLYQCRFTVMSTVQEIQAAILRLPPQERESLRQWLDGTDEETPEMLAAIDDGLRSLRENGVTPLEEIRKRIPLWATG